MVVGSFFHIQSITILDFFARPTPCHVQASTNFTVETLLRPRETSKEFDKGSALT